MSGLLEAVGVLTNQHPGPIVKYWVDGGMLGGRNPSTVGVFWSAYCSVPTKDAPNGLVVARQESHSHFTNNDAEWLAVQAALCHASIHHKGQSLVIHSDSELIVNQFMRRYKINNERLRVLAEQAWRLANGFHNVDLVWVSRKVMVKLLGH